MTRRRRDTPGPAAGGTTSARARTWKRSAQGARGCCSRGAILCATPGAREASVRQAPGADAMNVLLLSMPDSFEHMPPMAIRMPNGALASLAGNVDSHHRVAIADLILVQSSLRSTIERLVREIEPDIVGLSVMTFQRATALAIAKLLRALRPSVRIAVGGYDPSLAPAAYEGCRAIDFIVRGEGEQTLSDLLRALETAGATAHAPRQLAAIAGLSYRLSGGFVRNADRPIMALASSPLELPNRDARVIGGYTMLGRTVDVVETSRGCTFDCSFCSIIEMRGRNFHPYPIDRVLADIADARAHGAEAIFLVDDNITLDVKRFEQLCEAIVDAGFEDTDFVVQAMTAPIAQHGARLAPLMRRAGFRYVFLGIENIVDEDVSHYDGTTAVVRTEHVAAEDVEFLRWRAERWMKVRHMPAALAHSPMYVLQNAFAMLTHTFAGTTLRSLIGLEDERAVFARFREHRRRERDAYRQTDVWCEPLGAVSRIKESCAPSS